MEQRKAIQFYLLFLSLVSGITITHAMDESQLCASRRKYFEYTRIDLKSRSETQSEMDIAIYVKNSSKGAFGETYDIHAQVVPALNVSSFLYEEEKIPYNDYQMMGLLSRIDDIKTRGNTRLSPWSSNKVMMDKIKEDVTLKYTPIGQSLRLIVVARVTGFYIDYYEWFSPPSVSRSNSGEFEVGNSSKCAKKERAKARRSLELLREQDSASGTDL